MSKWVIALAAVVGMAWVNGFAADAPQKAEKEKGLVAYWSFDEGTGDTAKDLAGKNNGKIVDAKWVDGKFGKALDFNGESACVKIPDSPALNLTKAISIEAWVKHRGDFKQWESILAKGDGAYRLHFNGNDFGFDLGLNGAGSAFDLNSGVRPDSDKWYFVVATFDGKLACIYVDGKLAASAKTPSAGIASNNSGITIGDNQEGGSRFLNGVIDEVKIYDRALTAAEVATHFQRK